MKYFLQPLEKSSFQHLETLPMAAKDGIGMNISCSFLELPVLKFIPNSSFHPIGIYRGKDFFFPVP